MSIDFVFVKCYTESILGKRNVIMIVKVKTGALCGLDGKNVIVEADFSNGLPSFDIVGLPDTAVKESKERVRSAIKNSGFDFPAKHAVINLAPADLKKEGTQFDLPIAIAILAGTGQLKASFEEYMFIGELGLSGELRPVNGVLSLVSGAKESGIKKVVVPLENVEEAALQDGIEVFGTDCLEKVYRHLTGETLIDVAVCDIEKIFSEQSLCNMDFSDVRGQHALRRGVELCVSGGHNLLLIGTPGSGKSMIAQRIPTILPEMTLEEAIEVTKIYSIAGEIRDGVNLIAQRPFRAPHHSASAVSIVGGGPKARPGEISLAHNGVLFLDEFPEYKKDVIESMRQPLEDKRITVSRSVATYTYPCNTMLVVALNPCKCGYYGDGSGKCRCTEAEVRKYLGKISGPMLDRIDIQLEAAPVKYTDLNAMKGESSADIKKRVNAVREIQKERYKNEEIACNAQLSGALIEKYCPIGKDASDMLKSAFDTMGLTARAYGRILKVARTIADSDGRENINEMDIAEAIGYRSLDRKYFL